MAKNINLSIGSFYDGLQWYKNNCKVPKIGDEIFSISENLTYKYQINTGTGIAEWEASTTGGGIAKESDPLYIADKPNIALKSELHKIVDYPTHDALLADLTQKEGTFGKTSNPANELFIFMNGKWHEVGNENVKVYATDAQRLGTQVLDPQLAHVVDTGKTFFWTGRVVDGGNAKWIDLGAVDVSALTTEIAALKTKDNQLAAQINNKQNQLTHEQMAILNTNPAEFVIQSQITGFQPKVLSTPIQIAGTSQTTVEGALKGVWDEHVIDKQKQDTINNDLFNFIDRVEEQVQTNYISQEQKIEGNINAIASINSKDVLQDAKIAQLEAHSNAGNQLVKFGTGLPLTTLAAAKNSVEATAQPDQKFDFLNIDNGNFETYIWEVNAQGVGHWLKLGNETIDLSSYATTTALNTAIAGLVSKSVYDTKMTSLDNSISALDSKNAAQDTRLTNVENKNTSQDTAITANTDKNTAQDLKLAELVTKDTELKALIDALTPAHSDDTDWIGVITYTVGAALSPVGDMSQLPNADATNVNKTIIVTNSGQQYMNLMSKYKGQTFYSWQAIADSASPLQPGATITKDNWMPLLTNPDFLKFIKIAMGDKLEPGTFRYLEGVIGTLEIGKNIDTYQVNSDKTNLHDSRLTTTAKDLVPAINELKSELVNKQDNLNMGTVKKTRTDGATDVVYSPLHLTSLDASGNRLVPVMNYDFVDKEYVDAKDQQLITSIGTKASTAQLTSLSNKIGDLTTTGITGANVAAQLKALKDASGSGTSSDTTLFDGVIKGTLKSEVTSTESFAIKKVTANGLSLAELIIGSAETSLSNSIYSLTMNNQGAKIEAGIDKSNILVLEDSIKLETSLNSQIELNNAGIINVKTPTTPAGFDFDLEKLKQIGSSSGGNAFNKLPTGQGQDKVEELLNNIAGSGEAFIGKGFTGYASFFQSAANTYYSENNTGATDYSKGGSNSNEVTFGKNNGGSIIMNQMNFDTGRLTTYLGKNLFVYSDNTNTLNQGGKVVINDGTGTMTPLTHSLADMLKKLNDNYIKIGDFYTKAESDANYAFTDDTGNLDQLATNDKTNLVIAINEVNTKIGDLTTTGLTGTSVSTQLKALRNVKFTGTAVSPQVQTVVVTGGVNVTLFDYTLSVMIQKGSDFHPIDVPLFSGVGTFKRFYGGGQNFVTVTATNQTGNPANAEIRIEVTGADQITKAKVVRTTL